MLTESERRLVLALARLQPTTLRDLAAACGWQSPKWTLDVVNRLRRRGIVCGLRTGAVRHWRAELQPARSVRLSDGIVVTEKGQIGRFVGVA
jgi:hypothetical protein